MKAIRVVALLVGVGLVAACGADGDPTPPAKAAVPGVTLSGEASIGISGKL